MHWDQLDWLEFKYRKRSKDCSAVLSGVGQAFGVSVSQGAKCNTTKIREALAILLAASSNKLEDSLGSNCETKITISKPIARIISVSDRWV